jgi:hypothetical protein
MVSQTVEQEERLAAVGRPPSPRCPYPALSRIGFIITGQGFNPCKMRSTSLVFVWSLRNGWGQRGVHAGLLVIKPGISQIKQLPPAKQVIETFIHNHAGDSGNPRSHLQAQERRWGPVVSRLHAYECLPKPCVHTLTRLDSTL